MAPNLSCFHFLQPMCDSLWSCYWIIRKIRERNRWSEHDGNHLINHVCILTTDVHFPRLYKKQKQEFVYLFLHIHSHVLWRIGTTELSSATERRSPLHRSITRGWKYHPHENSFVVHEVAIVEMIPLVRIDSPSAEHSHQEKNHSVPHEGGVVEMRSLVFVDRSSAETDYRMKYTSSDVKIGVVAKESGVEGTVADVS